MLVVSSSLLGSTALAACGSSDQPTSAAAPAAAAATQAPAAPQSAAGGSQAAIKDFAFAPQDMKVKVGEKITWTNDDSAPHTVTAKSGAKFDSGTLAPGASFTFTAKRAGTTQYFCAIHPSMTGTITVQ